MDWRDKWTLTAGLSPTMGCIAQNQGGSYNSEQEARDAWAKLLEQHKLEDFLDAFIFPPASTGGQPIVLKQP